MSVVSERLSRNHASCTASSASLGTEHPVGHRSQVGPMSFESINQPVVIGHRYLLLSRSVMTLTIRTGST